MTKEEKIERLRLKMKSNLLTKRLRTIHLVASTDNVNLQNEYIQNNVTKSESIVSRYLEKTGWI